MLVGRFGIILPVLAIAGNMANKKISPNFKKSIAIDAPIFAILLIFVIAIVGALTFFPAFTLGPILEHFLMINGQQY
jgi:K+-transporting ATPase ATPase A chain